MGCFGCSGKSVKETEEEKWKDQLNQSRRNVEDQPPTLDLVKPKPSESVKESDAKREEAAEDKNQLNPDMNDLNLRDICKGGKSNGTCAQTFTFDELEAAIGNFRKDCFLGEGGFGKVYRGHLKRTNQEVAIKQLDRNGLQGTKEFIVEVTMLSLANHPNLVKLIGFCAERDQRLLVYEYMPLGSLEAHLHGMWDS
ncbi:hypothetical protein CRG98_048435 [Punica granatum]|uniref:Protein kinase domain-containing protein n=1 Tax=Punica granatum TaxID=22663 RepID=A0A2I0HHL9_PUNGR|nr:hypothetical protein CRG98_048435 [Punica granatum]